MTLQNILSKITNTNLKNRLVNIAANDGGTNKAEIDTSKGYKELCKLLSGNKYQQYNDILLGLKVEYENTNPINNNTNNQVGNINGANKGNVIIGDGNAVGGTNSTNVAGNNNLVVTGNGNTIVISKNDDAEKVSISTKDKVSGHTSASLVYKEAIEDFVAFNDRIVNSLNNIDSKTAYSFFQEYKRLSGGNPKLLQNVYGVNDWRNVITLNETKHVIGALLEQAKGLGLQEDEAYQNLNQIYNNVSKNSSDDPTPKQAIEYDYAIDELLKRMSEKIKD